MSTFNPNSTPPKNKIWISPQHRIIIYNDAAYKEEMALRLNWRNVGIFLASLVLFLIGFAFIILRIFASHHNPAITVTGDDNMRDQLLAINGHLDSLVKEIEARDVYITQINKKINGEFEYQADTEKQLAENNAKDKDKKTARKEKMPERNPATEKIVKSAKDEKELNNNGSNSHSTAINLPNNSSNFSFFTPLKGVLTDSFSPNRRQYGLSVSAPLGSEIRAAQNGIVVMASWSADMGFFIIIQHPSNLISIYKNNAALLKKQGDKVDAGDAIAIIGHSKGKNAQTQLGFELWHYGLPLNPQKLMAFQ